MVAFEPRRALLDRAAVAARRLGLPYGAVTFERHPYAYLRHGRVPPVLTSLGERLRLLRQAGVDFVVLFPTDASVLDVPAEEFARDVLHARMRVRLVVVGENFRFGRGGTGGIATLRRLGSSAGLDGIEVGMVTVGGEAVSATRIRDYLAVGDVARGGELLGRPYEVVGWLSAYGPSTATVLVPATRAVPAPGRYLASVGLRGRVGGPRAAAVAVHAADGDPHNLEVRWRGGQPCEAPVRHPVRVMFETRA